jgi:hypothetical protein
VGEGMKFSKFGRFYNEFGGMEIRDFFSFFIADFPIFVVRRYQNNHSSLDEKLTRSYYIAILGFSFRVDPKMPPTWAEEHQMDGTDF